MKSLSSRFFPAAAALTVAVSTCFAAATVVFAQTPPPPTRYAPDAMRQSPPPGGPGMHGMHMMREVERLKTSLALNAQQSALWDKATAAMKPQGDVWGQMKGEHERMEAMLADPNFDPRKMAAEMDRLETEHRAKMAVVRDAWFAVYDSLNPAQRGQVREFLRERMSHGGHGGHEMRGGPGWERDGEHGGGRPSMPPPAPPAPAR